MSHPTTKSVLIIGGFDPTGNAGILRDFETCLRFETPALSFVTAWTAQSNQHFQGFHAVDLKFCKTLWKSLDVTGIAALKIGMLGNEQTVAFLVSQLSRLKKQKQKPWVVWDPVFKSTSGGRLITPAAQKIALQKLLSLTDLFTPNAEEACQILKQKFSNSIDGRHLAETLKAVMPPHTALYLKGGHLNRKSRDWFLNQKERVEWQGQTSKNKLRGTGCLFATAAACGLADGLNMSTACEQAKDYLNEMFAKTH